MLVTGQLNHWVSSFRSRHQRLNTGKLVWPLLKVFRYFLLKTYFFNITSTSLLSEYAFVTGGWSPKNSVTELLDINSEQWTTRASYPYATDISNYVSFYYQSSFIVFGCFNSGTYLATIASYNPASNSWTKLGDLNFARTHHTGVRSLNSFYIYGGVGDTKTYPNEKCTLTGNFIECTVQDNPLDRSVDYLFYI